MEQGFAFDQIANLYKAERPGYPKALVEDVVSYADLKQNDRILEVGCGTGQATKSFAERRFSIVAIDPGPEMLRVARETLQSFSNVEFVETTFEKWSGKQASFRLIIAAQSWRCARRPRAIRRSRSGGITSLVARSFQRNLLATNGQVGSSAGSLVPPRGSIQRFV